MRSAQNQVKRVITAIVGGAVLLLGVVAIPYPGPGWLIVFAGLAILATEFTWAQRVLDYTKHYYDKWGTWLKRQHPGVRLLVLVLTTLVVVATLWFLNIFSIVDGMLHLHMPWLHSPLGIFT
jgi:uncharacterized protein (TIGR02611 family)